MAKNNIKVSTPLNTHELAAILLKETLRYVVAKVHLHDDLPTEDPTGCYGYHLTNVDFDSVDPDTVTFEFDAGAITSFEEGCQGQ